MSPGNFPNSAELIGFNIPTRYTEDHEPHSRFPDIFYHRGLGVWMRGRWDLDYSNASQQKRLYTLNSTALTGEDAVFFPGLSGTNEEGTEKVAPSHPEHFFDVELMYQKGPDGKRRPLRERFVLRWAERLWDAVEPVDQKPSPYGEAMRNLIYVDMWDGQYADRSEFTAWMQQTVGSYIGGLTILQNWQGGGFDSNLPLSITDDLPPNPNKAGTPEQLRTWMEQMKSWGLAGLRTNYMYYKDKGSPIKQTVQRAINAEGKTSWHTQPRSGISIIKRQETYIKDNYKTTVTFSDQLTSIGTGFGCVDFTPSAPKFWNYPGRSSGAARLRNTNQESGEWSAFVRNSKYAIPDRRVCGFGRLWNF